MAKGDPQGARGASETVVKWWVCGSSAYVYLGTQDTKRARDGARARQAFATSRDLVSHYSAGKPHGDDADHLVGAGGEVAAALALGLPWEPQAGILGGPDLPHGIEVRTRRFDPTRDDTPALFVFRHDKPKFAAPFVLVVAYGERNFRVAGWCYGHEANRSRYLKLQDHPRFKPEGALIVPARELRPMLDLRSIVLGSLHEAA